MSRSILLGRVILLFLTLTALPVHADPANPLTGNFYGTIVLNSAGNQGSPVALGTYDLSMYLDVGTSAVDPTVQSLSSYILLEKTLIYPSVGTVGAKAVGPLLSGTVGPANFRLSSGPFTNTVGGKTVNRTFRIYSTTVTNGGNTVSGTYQETIVLRAVSSQDVEMVIGHESA